MLPSCFGQSWDKTELGDSNEGAVSWTIFSHYKDKFSNDTLLAWSSLTE